MNFAWQRKWLHPFYNRKVMALPMPLAESYTHQYLLDPWKAERVRNRLSNFKGNEKIITPRVWWLGIGLHGRRLKAAFLEEKTGWYRSRSRCLPQPSCTHAEKPTPARKRWMYCWTRGWNAYADISPIRLNSNGVNAFVSIMRGCNICVHSAWYLFTRGREKQECPQYRAECEALFNDGYREVTLLGQNVDSYHWISEHTRWNRNLCTHLMEMVAESHHCCGFAFLHIKRYYWPTLRLEAIRKTSATIYACRCKW